MSNWEFIVIQVVTTAFIVGGLLGGFWAWVVRPYLDRKVTELVEATKQIEPAVIRGVKKGVADTLKDLPESAWEGTVKESSRQFMKFGSGLLENGLSSFLGTAADMERKASAGEHKNEPSYKK